MKKIKGFSLVELIIAITLLASIGLLVGLNFNKIFNKEEKSNYEEFVNKIKSASDVYLAGNNNLLTELNTNRGFIEIKILDLKNAGLLSDDLTDPKTGEVLSDNKIVLVSLDEAGTVMFTYPAEDKEEHLQALNVTLDYDSNFDCLIGLDTVNLGLIDKDGYLVEDYFTNNPDKITCKTEVDTKVIGNKIVKYSYINQEGITKEATRNFIVIDHIFPIVSNINYTPTTWTKDNVTINAEINDLESGIDAYAISLDKCDNFIKTKSNNISGEVSENGEYSVCAKDGYGNVTEEKITITNIDKAPPIISDINKSTDEWVTSLTISTNIIDDQSKIVAYAINQTSSVSSVTWTNITETTTRDVSHNVSANGTYYIWAKDKVGNVSNKSIKISTIGVLKSISFSTDKLSSALYSGEYNAGSSIKAIKSVLVNNGLVASSSFSGSVVSYSLSTGTLKTGSYNTTCSESASVTSRSSSTYCDYWCPSGGLLSGTTCSGTSSTTVSGGCSWSCDDNGNRVGQSCTDYGCPSGYTKNGFSCGSFSCPGTSNSCTNYCSKSYSYPASCAYIYTNYYCSSGYTMVGSSCYKCSRGTLSGTSCQYSCTEYYTYYQYTVNMEYYI